MRKAAIEARLIAGGIEIIAEAGRDGGGKNGRQGSASDLHYPMDLNSFIAMVESHAKLIGEADKRAFSAFVNRLVLHRAGL